MILIATIEGVGGEDVREATAGAYIPGVSTNAQITLVLHQPPGLHLPWRAGDRVVVVVPEGGSAAGAVPIARAGSERQPQHPDNTEIRSEGGRNVVVAPSEGGEVRIGADPDGDATEYDGLMLYSKLAAEVVNLKAQITALANQVDLAGQPKPPLPTIGAAAAVGLVSIDITGGDAVVGARGAKP